MHPTVPRCSIVYRDEGIDTAMEPPSAPAGFGSGAWFWPTVGRNRTVRKETNLQALPPPLSRIELSSSKGHPKEIARIRSFRARKPQDSRNVAIPRTSWRWDTIHGKSSRACMRLGANRGDARQEPRKNQVGARLPVAWALSQRNTQRRGSWNVADVEEERAFDPASVRSPTTREWKG